MSKQTVIEFKDMIMTVVKNEHSLPRNTLKLTIALSEDVVNDPVALDYALKMVARELQKAAAGR